MSAGVYVNVCWWDDCGNEKSIRDVRLAAVPRAKDILDLEGISDAQAQQGFGDDEPHDLNHLSVYMVKYVVTMTSSVVEVWVNTPGSLVCGECGAQVDCMREHAEEMETLASAVDKLNSDKGERRSPVATTSCGVQYEVTTQERTGQKFILFAPQSGDVVRLVPLEISPRLKHLPDAEAAEQIWQEFTS